MDDVLEHLKDGIRRFQREIYPAQAQLYQRSASEPQRPAALIITCADSRIHPDLLTQAKPGEIFVTRNIGNLVPAYGEMMGGVSAVLEFAISALKVKHIVVCGHTDCGAMKALIAPETMESMPTVKHWLRNAHTALSVAQALRPESRNEDLDERSGGQLDFLKLLTQQNVLLQMQHVRTHPSAAGALARGALTLSGWVYDIARGEVEICEDGQTRFEPVPAAKTPGESEKAG